MAIYHMSVKIGGRSKGQSAVAAAAYRSGEKLIDQETGLTSDFTRKSGVVFSEISLCKNAPAEYIDRAILWNAVHQIEKSKNAQLWREFEVALPKELSQEEQIGTVRDFVNQLTTQGMCIDWSLHDKGDGNPHAHIMATTRSIEPSGKWAPKSRLVYDLDENGERIFQKVNRQGRKQYKSHKEDYNDWNNKGHIEEWRSAWAECCNTRLEENKKIDHRSYKRQGIDQIPTIHEGYIARKMEQTGKISERCEENRQIKNTNIELKQLEKELKELEEAIDSLEKEKGSVINAGKQRISDLLAGGSRTVNSFSGESSKGDRESSGGDRKLERRKRKLEQRKRELEQRKRELDGIQGTSTDNSQIERTDKLIAGYNREREEREQEAQSEAQRNREREQAIKKDERRKRKYRNENSL